MTIDIRWQQRFSNYTKALEQLTDAVNLSRTRELSKLEKQGLIQAFEYTHELAWKVLKDFLENRGKSDLYGSKDVTREAFRLGIIDNGEAWMSMISSRNLTSHTYNEKTTEEIVTFVLNSYFDQFLKLMDKLNSIKESENK
ncbi:nucleotidyltransferase substrate binding protein [Geovibrio ferrireducens]|uniref:nucleotidyltransferase substrate binding protein n=1 Tax=Geovibrio ferrireducens TaxID=46201 RepID=UPI00224630F8|nr:nucleotidyltransferase substrate binding protein [Geovibrio ferrireducens]